MEQLSAYLSAFIVLPLKDLEAFKSLCSIVHVQKNEIIQPVGHTCKSIYFVSSGMLRVFYYKEDLDITESFEPENSIVARAESLFAGRPSNKGIQAIESSDLIVINAAKLYALFDEHPKIERLYRLINESLYVRTINRIESLQFLTAEERYNNLIREYPEIIRRAPLKYIASYLGITQVSLSRIRALK